MTLKIKAACAAVCCTLLAGPASVWASLAEGYGMQSLPVGVEGQFTAHDGRIHYWTASSGYRIYDVSLGTTTTVGLPPNGTRTNGYGDAFGVLDAANGLFYAATLHGSSDSDVYMYDHSIGAWLTPGQAGIAMMNAYGGQAHGGQLYVSGLAEPWNGGYGQDTYIFAFDHSATVGAEPARHDTLIQTAGNSAGLAVAPNGDVYYGTFSDNAVYRWTAQQVASVVDDLYAPGAVDSFLTLADAEVICLMPGAGNGIAVDAGGNVFFASNGFDDDWNASHILAMVDPTAPGGYREIYSTDGWMDWFGPISVDGDFLNGGTLYFSPSTFGGDSMLAITVPEPATLALLSVGGMAAVVRRRRKA